MTLIVWKPINLSYDLETFLKLTNWNDLLGLYLVSPLIHPNSSNLIKVIEVLLQNVCIFACFKSQVQ